MEPIKIRGLKQNNLKNISLDIPKNKIVVFTGVSGSGKSSIVFDTVAAESQRQMNETYSAWVRGRLPKYDKPNVEWIENLNPSVIIDQSAITATGRSTVCTFLGFFDEIRKVFAEANEALQHQYKGKTIVEVLAMSVEEALGFFETNKKIFEKLCALMDVGPDGGTKGGEIVFTGTPREMMETADTITAKYLRK